MWESNGTSNTDSITVKRGRVSKIQKGYERRLQKSLSTMTGDIDKLNRHRHSFLVRIRKVEEKFNVLRYILKILSFTLIIGFIL